MTHKATCSVLQAAQRYFDPPLSRNAAYQAAARGDLPCIRIGGRLFVKVAELERRLGTAVADSSAMRPEEGQLECSRRCSSTDDPRQSEATARTGR